jgi:hypothetical protein
MMSVPRFRVVQGVITIQSSSPLTMRKLPARDWRPTIGASTLACASYGQALHREALLQPIFFASRLGNLDHLSGPDFSCGAPEGYPESTACAP